MKNLVFMAFVAGVLFVGVGMYQGWFQIEKTDDGKSTQVRVKIDNEGFAKSKAEFLQSAQDRLRDLADEIEKLRGSSAQVARAAGNNRESGAVDSNAELEQLLEKKKAAERQLEEIKTAGVEEFQRLKTSADRTIDELRDGFKGTAERLRNRRIR